MKPQMIDFVKSYEALLGKCNIVTTGTTGSLIKKNTQLKVQKMLSGPLGGDAQIASAVSEHKIDLVLFFKDPLGKHPHEPDINMLLRVCYVHNIPLGTNLATAKILVLNLLKAS